MPVSMFDSLTDLQSSQTKSLKYVPVFGLIPLLIYKALKQGGGSRNGESSLIPLLIYKALKRLPLYLFPIIV